MCNKNIQVRGSFIVISCVTCSFGRYSISCSFGRIFELLHFMFTWPYFRVRLHFGQVWILATCLLLNSQPTPISDFKRVGNIFIKGEIVSPCWTFHICDEYLAYV